MSTLLKTIILACNLVLLLIAGCQQKDEPQTTSAQKTLIIAAKSSSTPLYFSGIIQPIKIDNAISPVDGTVEEVLFTYGQEIKKDQLLIKLISTDLDKDYQEALSSFLTKKEKYANEKAKMIGTKDLHKAQIIPDNELISEEAALHDAYLAFIQARNRMKKVLTKTSLSEKDIELLKIGDENAVEKALTQRITDIVVKAQLSGIALKPPKGGNEKDAIKEIKVGTEVKTGQVVASIGDLTGIAVDLDVNEININNILPGLKAIVTGNGFPYTLTGYVKSTSYQAKLESTGALPAFHVRVIVPQLTPKQQKLIHVGMSAKVEITIENPPNILIPINAVKLKNGVPHVTIKKKDSSKLIETPIKTGVTTIDSVTVLQGLNPGDEIVISH